MNETSSTGVLANPQSLRDRLSEKIRAQFVDLIPDEEWKALVSKEIAAFTDGAGWDKKPSPLRQLIQDIIKEECEKRVRAAIVEELGKSEYGSVWLPEGNQLGSALSQMVKDAAPELASALFGQMVNSAIMSFRQAIQTAGSGVRY